MRLSASLYLSICLLLSISIAGCDSSQPEGADAPEGNTTDESKPLIGGSTQQTTGNVDGATGESTGSTTSESGGTGGVTTSATGDTTGSTSSETGETTISGTDGSVTSNTGESTTGGASGSTTTGGTTTQGTSGSTGSSTGASTGDFTTGSTNGSTTGEAEGSATTASTAGGTDGSTTGGTTGATSGTATNSTGGSSGSTAGEADGSVTGGSASGTTTSSTGGSTTGSADGSSTGGTSGTTTSNTGGSTSGDSTTGEVDGSTGDGSTTGGTSGTTTSSAGGSTSGTSGSTTNGTSGTTSSTTAGTTTGTDGSTTGGTSGTTTGGTNQPVLGGALPNDLVLEDANVSGGGFQGDVTITGDGMTVYSSADVSGLLKSTDGGLRFETHNRGLESFKVASMAITPDNDQILYAGSGDKGNTGGVFRSINGGETWAITNAGSSAQFAGNHSASSDPVPIGHPRSNGDLIVVDEGNDASTHTDDLIIAGTYKAGVRILTQGGDAVGSAVNTNGFVRSIARNAATPGIAYAAIQFSNSNQNGIYRIDYSDPLAATSTLEYSALQPEGLTVLSSGNVYGAIGAAGVVKFDGVSWAMQSAGLSTNNNNRQWTAVTGYVANGNDVVYAGTNNLGGPSGANYSSIWRTVNGGDSWQPLVNADNNVVDTIYGQQHAWWFRTVAFPQAGLGRKNSVVSSIEVALGASANSVADDIIYVSGRGGIWKSDNGGGQWQPAVNNMQVTANNDVAVNPNNASQVVLANTDFVVLQSGANFENANIVRDKPSGAESKAYDVLFDSLSDEVIIGVGDRDTNNPGGGEVFIKSSTGLGGPADSGWTNTNLAGATAGNNGRVRGVAVGYHDGASATTQTVLAAVEGEGVYRYHNNVWSKSTGISIGSTDRSKLVWPDNSASGVVYLIDLSSGLFRSSDGGQSWVNIWPSMSFKNNDFYNTGYIAADSNDPTTLYLSLQGNNGSPIGTGFVVGPLGGLWLTEQQDAKNSIDAALYLMTNPATDTSFTRLNIDGYSKAAVSPSGVAVSSDGFIYISQDGLGVVKIGFQ